MSKKVDIRYNECGWKRETKTRSPKFNDDIGGYDMRLEKMYGLLMKAFLAVLMLFVTAAAVEVSNDIELEKAINEKCDTITLMPYEYEYYLGLDEPIEINFDMVLDLGGNELVTYFRITKGAKVTIKNGELSASGDPIIEVCGSDDEERPTVLILEDLKIEASRGIQINNDGYIHIEVNNIEIQTNSYHGWCLQISGSANSNRFVEVLVNGSDLFSTQGYVIECNSDAEVYIRNAKLSGAAGVLMQAGSLTMENTVLITENNSRDRSIPTNAIAFMPATGAVRVILTLGPDNQISSKSGAIFHVVPTAQGSVAAQIAITGGTFITENGHPLFSAPEEIGKIVGISGGSFPGISPEESAALAPFLNENLTVDENGNIVAKPQEAGVIIVQTDEEDRTQSNPSTGAPINAVGHWIWSIAFLVLSGAR